MTAFNKTCKEIWQQQMNLTSIFSLPKKGVLELVKEQQFFIDSHIILIVQYLTTN